MKRTWLIILGFGGLIPFVALAMASWWLAVDWHALSVRAIEIYAAVILSFLGGVHWGVALAHESARGYQKWLIWGVVPGLLAWGCVLLPWSVLTLSGLILLMLLSWQMDRRALADLEFTPAYLWLRTPLTAVASLALLTVIASFIRVGV